MNLSKITRWTVGQIATEELQEALRRTNDKQKRQMIQKELDSRKALGVNRPLTIEDYLG
jgi:hypothetical protein